MSQVASSGEAKWNALSSKATLIYPTICITLMAVAGAMLLAMMRKKKHKPIPITIAQEYNAAVRHDESG